MLTARKVVPGDADLFLAMARDFHEEDGHPLNEAAARAVREVAAGVALAPAFLLEFESEIMGFFVLSLGYSPEHGGADAFIDDIYIVPEQRGRGLGRQAMELAMAQCAAHGARVLLLEVEAENDRAYQLYRSLGFTDTKRRLLRLVLKDD